MSVTRTNSFRRGNDHFEPDDQSDPHGHTDRQRMIKVHQNSIRAPKTASVGKPVMVPRLVKVSS